MKERSLFTINLTQGLQYNNPLNWGLNNQELPVKNCACDAC